MLHERQLWASQFKWGRLGRTDLEAGKECHEAQEGMAQKGMKHGGALPASSRVRHQPHCGHLYCGGTLESRQAGRAEERPRLRWAYPFWDIASIILQVSSEKRMRSKLLTLMREAHCSVTKLSVREHRSENKKVIKNGG